MNDKGHARAEVSVINGGGITVLEAETTGVLPSDSERQRLSKMLNEGDTSNHVTLSNSNTLF